MKKRCLGVLLALAITLAQMPPTLAVLYGVATGETIRKMEELQEGSHTFSGEFRVNPDSESKQRTAAQNVTVKGSKGGGVAKRPSDSEAAQDTSSADNTEQWIPVGNQTNHWGSLHATIENRNGEGLLTISGEGPMETNPAKFTSAEALFQGELSPVVPWKDDLYAVKAVDIQLGITSIANMAFAGGGLISKVSIADSVTSVGIGAFADCKALPSIELPSGVASIGEYAFWDCGALVGIAIPSGVSVIREGTFGDCGGLLSVALPDGLTAIEKEAFGYCTSLTSVSIPNTVTSVGAAAFYSCSGLKNATLSGAMSSIADATFYGCSGLNSVSIPAGITNIGEGAFTDCDALTDIYYGGDEAQWNGVTIGAYNEALASATIHYGTEGQASQNNAVQSNHYVSGQFTDVPADSWCADYVKVAYEKGIMNGKTDDYFDVTGSLTVAQAIVMASRLHSGYNGIDGNFHSAQPWYQSYLDYALAHGIVTSVREDYNIPATRAEYAAILGKALPASALAEISSIEVGAIPDVSPDSEHYDAIYQLYRAGVLTGNDAKGTFAPDSNISRGAAAAIISRMAEPSLRKSITLEAAPFEPVPMKELANLQSLRKKCTDAELKEAYDIAVQLVEPFAKLSREEQLQGIMKTLREYFENGMTYSTSTPHYNDPYGYLVLKTASCAGCTRTTGLCLNILGIPYEHENPDSWTHQWCRVDVNGTYWICDAYGLYCGPEPAPHTHPRLS